MNERRHERVTERTSTGLGERLVWAFFLWLFIMTVGGIALKLIVLNH